MEDREIKHLIEETFHAFSLSSSNRYDFYDLTASIIGWKALSDHEKTSFDFVMRNIGTPNHKNDVLWALRNCNKYNHAILEIDENIIDNISDRVWIKMCTAWVDFFSNQIDELHECKEIYIAVIDALEAYFPQSSEEFSYLAPKELVGMMVDFIDGNFGETLYDPFCRSGNLLSVAADKLKGIKQVFGFTSERLAWKFANLKMMIINDSFEVLISMKSLQKSIDNNQKYDSIITNPPFGRQSPMDYGPFNNGDWDRFAQRSRRMDVFFLCHVLNKLSTRGKASIILPSTFLSSQGLIRELMAEIVKKNILDAVVSLPAGIFPNTGVSTILLCLNMQRHKDKKIFIIDATTSFEKSGKHVILNQDKLALLMKRIRTKEYRQVEQKLVAVTLSEVQAEGFDLRISSYLKNDFDQNIMESSKLLYQQCLDLEEKLLEAKNKLLDIITSR